jgi:hypothetical protein
MKLRLYYDTFDSSEIKSKVKQYLFAFVEGNYEILL